jgi:preprotein translocase subunit SecB
MTQPAIDATQNAAEIPSAPVFLIDRIFMKDASFEVPGSPHILYEPDLAPHVHFAIKLDHQHMAGIMYEVAVTATVHVKKGGDTGDTIFLAEVTQAGTFQIAGFDEATLALVLGASAPNVLFPYLREAVAGLASRAGFLPLYLQPINFEHMLAMQQKQLKEAANQSIH